MADRKLTEGNMSVSIKIIKCWLNRIIKDILIPFFVIILMVGLVKE